MRNVCTVEGCVDVVKGHGLCNKHLLRLKLTGTTDAGYRAPALLQDRFWRWVDKRGEDDCWNWVGSKRPNGYGKIGEGGKGGKQLAAHRLSCEWAHGAPPFVGCMALHSCDNPACVNPKHLRWGTGSQNIQEAFDKGRKHAAIKTGAANARTVLNVDQVKFIKANRHLGAAKLTRLIGGNHGAVRAVLDGRTWKHIRDENSFH